MGGGFGSKALSVGAEGLICARLAKEANAPVKLMLDRKEEHLATGNRPSASARIKAGVSADGHHHRVRRRIVGHGRRRRGRRLSAALHLSDRESPPHPQGRVHQHRSAAADAGPGTSAGLVPHRDHDGRARRQGEHGSGRVPDQEPAARSAERDVARLPARGRGGVRMGQAASDRRQDAGPDQDRHGRGDLHVGRRRPRPGAGPLRDRVRRQRRHAHRHARTSAPARARSSRWSPPTRSASRRRRSSRRLATRSTASVRCRAAAPPPPSISPAIRVAAVKALDALKEKVAPVLGVEAGIARRRRRPHPRQGQAVARPVVGGGLQAHRPAADCRRRRLAAGDVVGDHERRAVRRGHGRRRDGHHQGDADSRHPGLRPGRQPPHRRKPDLRRRDRLAELRDVRGPHPRPQHRADGQPEHGVVPARRHVGHPADRRAAEGPAGARRHRHRRAADGADRGGHRPGGPERDRRDAFAACR